MEEREVEYKVLPLVTLVAVFFVGIISVLAASASEITPENIINNINQQRSVYGLTPLNDNQQLDQAAYNKSVDMLARNYFEHYAFGLTPWMFIVQTGYDYSIAGENLAKGFSSAEEVVTAWMNSPTHRANILNPNYQDIGVGVVKGVYSENGKLSDTTLTTELTATQQTPAQTIIQRISNFFTNLF